MTYPGNPSLAPEARERVESTFRNSLQAVEEGKDQEAILGCEFVLRMDPDFQPATTLIERLRSGQRPVQTGDLLGGAAAPSTTGLGAVLQDLLQRRNFQQVLQIAQSQSTAIQKDPALLRLVQTAQEKLESEQFIQKFLQSARSAMERGNPTVAESFLEKARALDPDHPDIAALGQVSGPEPGPEQDLVFAEAEAIVMPDDEPVVEAGDLMALQQQSLGLGDEEEDDFLSLEDDDDLAGLDEDLEALDLGDDLESLDEIEDAGDLTRPSAPVPDLSPPAEEAGFEDLGGDDLDTFDDLGDFDDGDGLLDLGAADEFAESSEPDPFADLDSLPEPEASEKSEEPLDFDDDTGLDLDDDFETPEDVDVPAAPSTSEEEDDASRIQRLLAEGKEVFDREDFQAAIDIWSRIFLIDIDNSEASRLIEEARKRKAELDRQAEELFHEAESQIEAQELEEAKETLEKVLGLHSEHSLAKSYLEQLEAGKVPTISRRSADDLDPLDDLDGSPGAEGDDDQKSMEAAVQRDRIVVVKRTDKKLVALGVAGLVVVLGGGGFLVSQWDRLFPNAEAPSTAPMPQVNSIERATQMQENGRTENAIALLRKVQPDDPSYSEAQALIDQWTALIESQSDAPAGPSEEVLARREVLLDAARLAFDEGRNLKARKYFDRAHRVFPLESEDLAKKRESEERLTPLQQEIDGFGIGEYEQILPSLWRRLDSKPLDKDVRRLIVDSYYNLALRDLQRGDPSGAASKLKEAIGIETDNEELERLRLFADTYRQRSPDLIYRIFVKYLPSKS